MFIVRTYLVSMFVIPAIVLVGCGRQDPKPSDNPDTTTEVTVPAQRVDSVSGEPVTPVVPETTSALSYGSAPLIPASKRVVAPDFSLPDSRDQTFRLSDHKGKVLVLNFWATWCPPCREEIPDFVEIQRRHEKDGLVFVGISEDEEGWEVVRPYLQEINVNYPVLLDDGKAAELYGPISGLPTTFVVDRKGVVRFFSPGMLTKEVLEPALVNLLKEKG